MIWDKRKDEILKQNGCREAHGAIEFVWDGKKYMLHPDTSSHESYENSGAGLIFEAIDLEMDEEGVIRVIELGTQLSLISNEIEAKLSLK